MQHVQVISRIYFFASLLLLFNVAQIKAQTSTLDRTLYLYGFDKVSSSISNKMLCLHFENRYWRSDAKAIYEILDAIDESVIRTDSLRIHLMNDSMVFLSIETKRSEIRKLLLGEINYQTWVTNSSFILGDSVSSINHKPTSKTSHLLEFGLTPQYQLGNYNNPLRLRLEITPELTALLPFGVRFRGGIGLPVYNDLDQNRTVRLSHLSLTRQFQVQPGLYGGVSAGFFSRNRAGAHIQFTQYLWDERFSFTYQGGYTRFSSAMGAVDDLFVEDQPYVVSTVAAEYRWKKYHLDLNIEYGQFLYYDSGFKMDVQRYFGETIIGMFVLQTRRGTNYGFHVSIPLFPRKGARVSGLMVRSASHVPFSYRYEGNDLKGRMYRTGIDYPTRLKRVYPSYLLDELEAYFEGI